MATEKNFRYQHILSNVEDKAPTSAQILDGEIAVNTFAGSEKMFIKNASGNIVSFSSDQAIGTMISDSISGKADTSAVTESINAATSGKVDTTTFETYSGAVDTEIGSKAAQSDLNTLSGTVTGHTADTTIHLTSTEKEQLHTHSNKSALDAITGNVGTMAYESTSSYSSATEVNTALGNKANTSDLADFFDDAKYEDSGTTKVINFYNGNTIKATIDATDFIVDGMVESVSAGTSGSTTVLDIKWNTAAGGQETILDIGDMFEADNYYTKSETSGATEISNALDTKVNSATFTGHTADTTIHFTTGAVQTQIDNSISGKVNTSDIVTAITSSNSGSSAPVSVKVVAENELVVSTALNDLNAALSGKSDTGHTHVSNEVTAMTGYSKAASGSSITTSDSLNVAIGKLEAYVDDLNSQSETVAAALVDLYSKIGDIETLLSQI